MRGARGTVRHCAATCILNGVPGDPEGRSLLFRLDYGGVWHAGVGTLAAAGSCGLPRLARCCRKNAGQLATSRWRGEEEGEGAAATAATHRKKLCQITQCLEQVWSTPERHPNTDSFRSLRPRGMLPTPGPPEGRLKRRQPATFRLGKRHRPPESALGFREVTPEPVRSPGIHR